MPMKKALVTGAAGFVGRHTAAELHRRGWTVHAEDITTGWDSLTTFTGAGGPLVDAAANRLAGRVYDLVVHAAASSPHRAAIDGEPQHLARNLQLDAAMFDWAVRTGQGRVLYLSSSAAYSVALQTEGARFNLREEFIDLTDAEEPDADYGWAKLSGERMAAAARRAGLPVTVVRPFSGYGEDQSENFPFRALVERARRREDPYVIWGDGNQVRDWIHIDDVIAGMLAVAESGTDEPVNLCTGVGTSMRELAELACELVGYKPDFEFLADKPAGVAYRVGDPARFHEIYKPTITLAEGVARALAP
jgi:nucleoside-diphosphate-sugar epimerase